MHDRTAGDAHLEAHTRLSGHRVVEAAVGGGRRGGAGHAALARRNEGVEGVPERLRETHADDREHAHAAAALSLRIDRVGADERNLLDIPGRNREQAARVGEQHEGPRGHLSNERGVDQGSRRGCNLVQCPALDSAVERAHPAGEREQPHDLVIDVRLRHPSRPHGGNQVLAPGPIWSGHHKIEAARRARHGGLGGGPVRDHDSGKLPLRLEHVAEQNRVRRHRGSVDRVVRRHDQGDIRLGNNGLERREVDLPKNCVRDSRVIGAALRLGVVGDVVLGGRAHAGFLDAAHIGNGETCGEQWVLGEAFETATAQRSPDDVYRRSQEHVDASRPRFLAECEGDVVNELLVPRRAQGDWTWQR